jgi:hypothetical protein
MNGDADQMRGAAKFDVNRQRETLNKSLASVASAGLGDLKPHNSST